MNRPALSQKVLPHAIRFEAFLKRWAPFLILAFALLYYGQYYRTGLNLGGEGGTNAVLAMRIMEGQRPIVDTFLGYNLLWFYPLIGLFHITGPSYIAMRIFFFILCTLNAFLGFAIVKSCTRQAWLALTVAIFLLLVPGMLFRNYMGLIGTLSMLLFLKAYVLPSARPLHQILWMGASGGALGLCFLIRIEPSLLLGVVWFGLAVLYPFGGQDDFLRRLRLTLLGSALGLACLIASHVPFLWISAEAGYGKEFRDQYASFGRLLLHELTAELAHIKQPVPPPSPETVSAPSQPPRAEQAPPPQAPPPANQETSGGRDGRLGRPALSAIPHIQRPAQRAFALMLYYAPLLSLLLVAFAIATLLMALVRGEAQKKQDALIILTSVGCALSLFPQYFFFRPDPPHLSEFMVPFLPALAVSSVAIYKYGFRPNPLPLRFLSLLLVFLCLCTLPLYMKAIMPRASAGTIFKTEDLVDFQALNGVNVKLPPSDAKSMEGLRDAILEHSKPSDYVICYPYSPTINFLTNRRSYEYNLYVDNSTADNAFQLAAIERMKKFQPPVIVIDNWPINRTEESRFKNWATLMMAYIEENYFLQGVYDLGSRANHVYLLKKQGALISP